MAVQNISSATQYPSSGSSTSRQQRSFADLYRQAREASINDNGTNNPEADQQETRRNREYIEGLHNRVDTLRGEILARVITARVDEPDAPDQLAGDITRLSTRLETLRNKLRNEEERLSGTLVDVTI